MISILKIPFDLGLVEEKKRGAADAPEAIQKECRNIFYVNWDRINWVDVPVSGDFESTQENIKKTSLEEYKKNNFVASLGGDHSVSYGLIKAFSERFSNSEGKHALVYFDAHFDCQDKINPPSHEDILKAIINEGIVSAENILVIGVRNYTQKELSFILEKKVRTIFMNEITEKGIVWLGKEIEKFCEKYENVYFSLDVDFIDPVYITATGWPEPGGVSSAEINYIVEKIIKTSKIKGFDITELSPVLDKENLSLKLVSHILAKSLSNLYTESFI